MSVHSGSDSTLDQSKTDSPIAHSSAEAEPLNDEVKIESPGEQLRNAREALGLACEDVASELRLDLKIIKALEENDLSHLPEPVFTAGYLRSYARMVGLPPDKLVKQYVSSETRDLPSVDGGFGRLPERYRKVADALPNSFSVSKTHHAHASNIKKQALLVIGMLVVVLLSWQSTRWFEQQPGQPAVEQTGNVAAPSETIESTPAVEQGAPVQSGAQPLVSTKLDNEIVPGNTTQAQANNAAQIQKPLALKPIAETAQSTITTATGEPAPIEEITQLMLRFTENSWVDIRDSTGKRLVRELGFKGAHKQISGVAPFQVLLGYGPGVELEYNGKPYDFSDYQDKKIARFTLNIVDGSGLNISAPSSQTSTSENALNTDQERTPVSGDPEIGD